MRLFALVPLAMLVASCGLDSHNIDGDLISSNIPTGEVKFDVYLLNSNDLWVDVFSSQLTVVGSSRELPKSIMVRRTGDILNKIPGRPRVRFSVVCEWNKVFYDCYVKPEFQDLFYIRESRADLCLKEVNKEKGLILFNVLRSDDDLDDDIWVDIKPFVRDMQDTPPIYPGDCFGATLRIEGDEYELLSFGFKLFGNILD